MRSSTTDSARRKARASLTRHRQLRAMGDAVKQPNSDLGLKIPNLLAERRLPDSDLSGRAREVTLLRDRQEVANVTQLHHYLQKISKKSVS